MNNKNDLFNQVQVGYVVIESARLDEWKRFGKDGLGLHLAEDSADLLAFRIDSHQRRIIVRRGPAEDVVAIGMHLQNDVALQEVLSRLRKHGISVSQASPATAQQRGVAALHAFRGPKGIQMELFTTALTTDAPLQMLSSGFITGDGGMGHAAITARQPDRMLKFWQDIFDARISDYIEERIAGMTLDITFLRFNERHHSLAIAATRGLRLDPIRTRVQHFNLVAESMDDLVSAFRRLKAMGYGIVHEIGQHPNDKELSFYVQSPSGFEWEMGWNALKVDEPSWHINTYQGISLWGHKPQKPGILTTIKVNSGNLGRGLKSLLQEEFIPQ